MRENIEMSHQASWGATEWRNYIFNIALTINNFEIIGMEAALLEDFLNLTPSKKADHR